MVSKFRDQAAVLQLAAAILGVLVAFQLGVTDEQASLWMFAIDAVLGLIAAALVKPFAPAALATAVSAVSALIVGYGFEITPEKLSAVNFAVVTAAAFFFVRPNSTPKSSPAIGQGVTSKDVSVVGASTSGRTIGVNS